MKPAVFVCISALLAGARVLPAASGNVVVRTITVERLPAVDVPADPFLARYIRLVNRINGVSREYVVRRELLFAPGEPLDTVLVQETARNLRSISIFGDIRISCEPAGSDSVDVTVRVRDKWTKIFELSYEQDGGVREASTALRDNNVAGTHHRAGGELNYRSDRDVPLGYALSLDGTRLFGTRWDGALTYRDTEEQNKFAVSADRPFYALRARWSGGAGWSAGSTLDRQYADGESVLEREYRFRSGSAWALRRFHGPVRTYAGCSFAHRDAAGDSLPALPDVRYDVLGTAVTLARVTYREARYFDNFGRTEDLSTGITLAGGAAANLRTGSDSLFRNAYRARLACAGLFGERAYASLAVEGGMLAGGIPATGHWVEGTARAAFRLPLHQTLAFRFKGLVRNALAHDREDLYLDSPTGLRGYPLYGLGGRSRVVCNAEYRLFSPWRIWFMHVGGVLFYDGGAVFGPGDDPRDLDWQSSVGGGLRFGNPTQRGSGIARFEVAWNGETGEFGEVMITSGNLFSAFEGLTVLGPGGVHGFK